MQPLQEISGICRAMARIHPSKSNLAMDINAGQNVSPLAIDIETDGINGNQESGAGFLFKFSNTLLETGSDSFGLSQLVFLGMEVELVLGDNSLDLPRRYRLLIYGFIYHRQLHLAVADVSGAKSHDPSLFFPGNLPDTGSLWTAAFFFKRGEIVRIVSFSPFVEGFGSNVEVPAGFSDGMALMIIVHPFEAPSGRFGDV